jgi:hypothetical protein
MRSVTGIVTILPFPVLTSAWGARPLPHPATKSAAILHKQFPNLQNETGAVLRASNFVPAEKRMQDKPARYGRQSLVLSGGNRKIQEIRNKKKTRRQE